MNRAAHLASQSEGESYNPRNTNGLKYPDPAKLTGTNEPDKDSDTELSDVDDDCDNMNNHSTKREEAELFIPPHPCDVSNNKKHLTGGSAPMEECDEPENETAFGAESYISEREAESDSKKTTRVFGLSPPESRTRMQKDASANKKQTRRLRQDDEVNTFSSHTPTSTPSQDDQEMEFKEMTDIKDLLKQVMNDFGLVMSGIFPELSIQQDCMKAGLDSLFEAFKCKDRAGNELEVTLKFVKCALKDWINNNRRVKQHLVKLSDDSERKRESLETNNRKHENRKKTNSPVHNPVERDEVSDTSVQPLDDHRKSQKPAADRSQDESTPRTTSSTSRSLKQGGRKTVPPPSSSSFSPGPSSERQQNQFQHQHQYQQKQAEGTTTDRMYSKQNQHVSTSYDNQSSTSNRYNRAPIQSSSTKQNPQSGDVGEVDHGQTKKEHSKPSSRRPSIQTISVCEMKDQLAKADNNVHKSTPPSLSDRALDQRFNQIISNKSAENKGFFGGWFS